MHYTKIRGNKRKTSKFHYTELKGSPKREQIPWTSQKIAIIGGKYFQHTSHTYICIYTCIHITLWNIIIIIWKCIAVYMHTYIIITDTVENTY